MSYPLALVAVLLVVAVVGAILLKSLAGKQAAGGAVPPAGVYEKKRYLLTKAEKSFYLVLLQALPPELVVFPKVRLADVLDVRRGAAKRAGHLNRVTAKHIDFLVCDREWIEPRLAIELDDRSHDSPRRQARDEFLVTAAHDAGLPLLRIRAQTAYDTRALLQDFTRCLSGQPESSGS